MSTRELSACRMDRRDFIGLMQKLPVPAVAQC